MGIDKMSVTLNEIRTAASRISGSVHRTDVKTCSALNSMAGDKELFFKCEMWQKTGSFKARGALNGILSSREASDASIPMIVTHSIGNHGQAVAWAARHCQIPCTVVVPRGTPKVKVGQLTFPILCDLVDGVISVTDKEIAEGCRLLAERMKVMVEAASGAALAASLTNEVRKCQL